MDHRTTSTAQIWLDNEGIIHIVATGVASTADTTGETLGVLTDLVAGSRAPILFNLHQWPSGDPSFWTRFTQTLQSVCLAGAVVIDPQAVAKLGTFPSLINTLLIPFQVFSDEDEALAFLRSHISG